MANQSKPPQVSQEIEFQYIFEDDYNPIYVNGAYGGISPNKELVVHFYLERVGIPYSQTHELKADGKLGKEIERQPTKDHPLFVRVIKNGVILSLENAQKIHNWLGDKIKELKTIEGKSVGGSQKS